jgi:hypothetical protein
MPRSGSLTSRAQVWRAPEADAGLGTIVTPRVPVGMIWASVSRAAAQVMRDFGAGDLPQGLSEVTTHAGADVLVGDVLQVVAGPETATAWKIEDVSQPNLRDRVASCSAFNAKLTLPAP